MQTYTIIAVVQDADPHCNRIQTKLIITAFDPVTLTFDFSATKQQKWQVQAQPLLAVAKLARCSVTMLILELHGTQATFIFTHTHILHFQPHTSPTQVHHHPHQTPIKILPVQSYHADRVACHPRPTLRPSRDAWIIPVQQVLM